MYSSVFDFIFKVTVPKKTTTVMENNNNKRTTGSIAIIFKTTIRDQDRRFRVGALSISQKRQKTGGIRIIT